MRFIELVSCLFTGVKDYEFIQYTQLSDKSAALGDVIAKNIQCGIARERKRFIQESRSTLILNHQWKNYSR